MHQLQDEELVLFRGMIKLEFYEKAKELNNYFKKEFVRLIENEQQKELHVKVWPYQ